jgi:hypothetical protein
MTSLMALLLYVSGCPQRVRFIPDKRAFGSVPEMPAKG